MNVLKKIVALAAVLLAFSAFADDWNPLVPKYGGAEKPRKFSEPKAGKPRGGKPHMIAEVGDISCLPEVSEADAKGILERYKIYVNDGLSSKELVATARSVAQLGAMLGLRKNGRSWLDYTSVKYVDELPVRSDGGCLPGIQTLEDGVPTITFARRCPKKSMQGKMKLPIYEGTIVHEYGHVVANKGKFYPKYNQAVPEKCKISGYCTRSMAGRKHKDRNEEFAEVFAAYVVAPEELKQQCPSSYEYLAKNLFVGSASVCGKKSPPALK